MPQKIVAATFLARPDSKVALTKLILQTADLSRKEKGVEKYLVNMIDKDLGHFLLVGVYTSDEAFESHVNSIHVKKFLDAIPNLVSENFTYVSSPLEIDLQSDVKAKIY